MYMTGYATRVAVAPASLERKASTTVQMVPGARGAMSASPAGAWTYRTDCDPPWRTRPCDTVVGEERIRPGWPCQGGGGCLGGGEIYRERAYGCRTCMDSVSVVAAAAAPSAPPNAERIFWLRVAGAGEGLRAL